MTTSPTPAGFAAGRLLSGPSAAGMRRRAFLVTGLAASMSAGRADAAVGERRAAADALFDRFRAETGLADASTIVMRGEAVLHQRYAGRYTPQTLVPIASSSKWMFGALVMTLVDDGLLALDAPIGTYLPELPASHRALRVDALMSYTAGLVGLREALELQQPAGISLLESALRAARTPLAAPPGAQFDYGGANFQFVGAAAERVSGRTWHELFQARIAGPLGMTSTAWGRLRAAPDPRAPVANPVLQAGAWTTLPDYAAFLTMIAQDGLHRGRRILSARAVAAMGTIMTRGLPKVGPEGLGAQPTEYMVAHWCERPEGLRCTLESSPGYFGANPWIDRTARLHGVLLVQDRRQRIVGAETRLRDGLIDLFA
jgi:CubicO group peptidase (beta-lactamase class C family)